MSILKVARLGHPILRKKAKKVSNTLLKTGKFQELCDDMLETVQDYDGLGLAAPQVHESLRVIAINMMEENSRYEIKGQFRKKILVNPVITPLSDDLVESWEGCLSVNDLRGLVPRHKHIRLKALDRTGKKIELETDTFLSVVLQHEIDHLDGILLVDRVASSTLLSFEAELDKYKPIN